MKKVIMIGMLMSSMLSNATVHFKVLNLLGRENESGGIEEFDFNLESAQYMVLSPHREFVLLIEPLLNYFRDLRIILPHFDIEAPQAVELLQLRAQGLDVAPRDTVAQGIEQTLELIKKTPQMPSFPEWARIEMVQMLTLFENKLKEDDKKKSIKQALLKRKLAQKRQ